MTKWLEQSESQRLETLVIVIRAYSPTTNHPFYGWFVIDLNCQAKCNIVE